MKFTNLLEYTGLIIAIIAIVYLIVLDLRKPKDKIKEWLRYFIGIILTVLLFTCFYTGKKLVFGEETQKEYGYIDREKLLIESIAEVESGNDTTATNSASSASGHLQQLRIIVDDCNKIDTSKHYKYSDRFNKQKAEEMFRIIQNKYNPKGDIEKAIRLWNGGPGYTTASTQAYYEKVRAVYNRRLNEEIAEFVRNVQSLRYK